MRPGKVWAVLGSCVYATVIINIAKNSELSTKIKGRHLPRHLNPRGTITEILANNLTGGAYIAEVKVGTPEQTVTLAIDTGSSDVWVIAADADLCVDSDLQDRYGGCISTFDYTKSSTFKTLGRNKFGILYADQSAAVGDYVSETFSIGGATIKALQIGLAHNLTLETGILGIGYTANQASNSGKNPTTYPSIIDSMFSQGLINSKAYSLYLDDLKSSTGSIIFGGLDSDKYIGSLVELPVVVSKRRNGTLAYAELAVAMTSLGITDQAGNTTNFTTASYKEPAVLDSGTTISYLPKRVIDPLYQFINAYDDSNQSGRTFVDCSIRDDKPGMTFDYGFGSDLGVVIRVSVSELIYDMPGGYTSSYTAALKLPFAKACIFGIEAGGDTITVLGDSFLRSAYIVYDLQNNLIAMAQTNFNSSTTSIVEFQASATGIPKVSGVASSARGTATATVLGAGGNGHSSTASASVAGYTVTVTASPKSAASFSVRPLEFRGLFSVIASLICVLYGPGWFIT